MLAQRRHGVHAGAVAVVLRRRQQRGHRAGRRLHAGPALACLQLRMLPKCGRAVDAGGGDAGRVEPCFGLIGAQVSKAGADLVVEQLAVCGAQQVGGKARVFGHRRVLQHFGAKTPPFALVLHPQQQRLAVTRQRRAIGRDARMRGPAARRGCLPAMGEIHRVAHPLGQCFKHHHIDPGAQPGTPAQQQRVQHARIGIHAGADIASRETSAGHHLALAGDRQQTRFGLHHQVVSLFVAVRARVAIARNIADDQLRIARLQLLERQPEPGRRTRRQVLHQHIGLAQQSLQQRRGFRMLDVERQALFRAIGPDEIGRLAEHPLVIGAGEIADLRAFDLDHAGPLVGQMAGADRCGHGMFQRQDGDAVERADGHTSQAGTTLDVERCKKNFWLSMELRVDVALPHHEASCRSAPAGFFEQPVQICPNPLSDSRAGPRSRAAPASCARPGRASG